VSFADIRREYSGQPFDVAQADPNPFLQFERWFGDAREREPDPTAMTLATAAPGGRPSARIVLLKGVDDGGFVFFTNYGSRKAREIDATGAASLLFFWPSLARQVAVTGAVARVSAEASDAYFASRPRDSRLSVYASPQSRPIESRAALEAALEDARRAYPDGVVVPRPDGWGGYRLVPDEFEFWQGRESRLHDRLQYVKEGGAWRRQRLAP
jgi:pyridoxamine 5'-phosphate oxidase